VLKSPLIANLKTITGTFMRQYINILIFSLTLGLFACKSTSRGQDISVDKSASVESTTSSNDKTNKTLTAQDQRNDCVRGQAESVIKKEYYPNTTFVLQPDSLTAIETITFVNGDKLTIRNWGCEFYVLTFRFETSRFKADTTAMKYWYVTAHKMMTEEKHAIDAPIDIEKGLGALNEHISKNVLALKLQTEIDFGGEEIREFVIVEQIEKITNKKYALSISFATGPL
jgi:hypothetical protein